MTAFRLIVLMGIIGVFGQATHTASGWNYNGCTIIDPTCFSGPITLPNGQVTPEACQSACKDFQFAALVNEACYCGNDAKGIKPTDEDCCDHCCMNNDALGMCGSSCPEDYPNTANVYGKGQDPEQYSQVQAPPPPPPSTPCPEESTAASSAIAPSAPAVYTQSSMQPASAPPPLSQYSQAPPAPSQYHTPDGDAPEPQAYDTSSALAASTSSCTTTADQAAASEPAQTPAYQTILWPVSSGSAYGTPPVPSQVPGSGANPSFVSSFSTVGGLAIIAAMII